MLDSRRRVQCTRGCFEDCFRNVMLVASVQILDVEIETAFLHKCFQEFFDKLRLQIADSCRFEIGLVYEIRAAGKIDDHASQRFVQWYIRVTESRDATALTKCF